jgi:hypothetical protein
LMTRGDGLDNFRGETRPSAMQSVTSAEQVAAAAQLRLIGVDAFLQRLRAVMIST